MSSLPRIAIIVASLIATPLLLAQNQAVSPQELPWQQAVTFPLISPHTACNAGSIACGGSASGHIGPDSCVGLVYYLCYSFSGQKGQVVTVSAASFDFPIVAGITDSQGIIALAEASATGRSAVVTTTLPRTGTYYICVQPPPSLKVFGNYTLSVFCGSPGACIPTTTTACLLERRFSATMRYRAAYEAGVPDTDALVKQVTGFGNPSYETVFFYFNSPDNVELVVKMLDQGNSNDQGQPTIAALFGTATPLAVELTITDTRTGAKRTYASKFGVMRGRTDFTAFLK